jgi:integrase
MSGTTKKITENVRAEALRRVAGAFVPSTIRDAEIKGFALVVTTRRAFWCLFFQPKGINPATGGRWGGGVRHELGDAFAMSIADARTAALGAKARIRSGHDPHREAMASKASAVAERAALPTTFSETIDAYEKAVMARREPSEATRRQHVHYTRKAVRLMRAETLALSRLDASMIRLMVETAEGSAGERRHVFGALSRFLWWCRKQRLIERNPCDDFDQSERPKPGKARDHVPSIEELRAVWAAVEEEPMRDLIRFLLLTPLRRDEAAGLLWSEVDLDKGRILIGADRMKNDVAHELPLSPRALAILASRKNARDRDKGHGKTRRVGLVFGSGADKPFDGWNRLATRIRSEIGQADTPRDQAFTFHDVRRGFVSLLAERRYDVDLLDQCLSHTRKGVLGVYQRASRMAERSAAMDAWASFLLEEPTSDNVVHLHAAR